MIWNELSPVNKIQKNDKNNEIKIESDKIENNNTTGDHFDFAGSFQDAKIEFTFSSGSKNGVKYTGTISRNTTNEIITLNTPTGIIILKN